MIGLPRWIGLGIVMILHGCGRDHTETVSDSGGSGSTADAISQVGLNGVIDGTRFQIAEGQNGGYRILRDGSTFISIPLDSKDPCNLTAVPSGRPLRSISWTINLVDAERIFFPSSDNRYIQIAKDVDKRLLASGQVTWTKTGEEHLKGNLRAQYDDKNQVAGKWEAVVCSP